MNDIDYILSMIENPTRRRILQAIVREPHYPLQLSKELGISQQAIVKNLEVMEKRGMVVSYRESSNIGPNRTFYRPNSEFTITIDMRNGMFETNMIGLRNYNKEIVNEKNIDNTEDFQETREKISDIDKKLHELSTLRSEIVDERNRLIRGFLDSVEDDIDYDHRNLLYELLNNPDMNASGISEEMGIDKSSTEKMVHELLLMFDGTR